MENKKPISSNPKLTNQSVKRPVMARPVASVRPEKPATPAAPTRPLTHVAPVTQASAVKTNNPSVSTDDKSKKSKAKKNKKPLLIGIGIAVIIAIIIAVVVVSLTLIPRGDGEQGDNGSGTQEIAKPTEEEEKVTKEVLDKYAEVTVEGYKKVDDNEISSDIVRVLIKNISDERASLHIVVVAQDKDGKALDVSHMYAEGIMPGETQQFDAFVYTEMTPEQMKNAEYKVYTANTYEAAIPEESETEEE